MAAATRLTLDSYGIGDRVTLIEGPAQESVKRLEGTFDLIFVDANKDGYQGYVQAILDRKLLSPKGLILCDNSKYLHTPNKSRKLRTPANGRNFPSQRLLVA